MVSIPACHVGDRSSILRRGAFFVTFFLSSFAFFLPFFATLRLVSFDSTWILCGNNHFLDIFSNSFNRLDVIYRRPSAILVLRHHKDGSSGSRARAFRGNHIQMPQFSMLRIQSLNFLLMKGKLWKEWINRLKFYSNFWKRQTISSKPETEVLVQWICLLFLLAIWHFLG